MGSWLPDTLSEANLEQNDEPMLPLVAASLGLGRIRQSAVCTGRAEEHSQRADNFCDGRANLSGHAGTGSMAGGRSIAAPTRHPQAPAPVARHEPGAAGGTDVVCRLSCVATEQPRRSASYPSCCGGGGSAGAGLPVAVCFRARRSIPACISSPPVGGLRGRVRGCVTPLHYCPDWFLGASSRGVSCCSSACWLSGASCPLGSGSCWLVVRDVVDFEIVVSVAWREDSVEWLERVALSPIVRPPIR